MKRFLPILLTIAGLMTGLPGHAQAAKKTDSLKVSFYYVVARYDIDSNFVRHQKMIEELADTCKVDSALIHGFVSPEGGEQFNARLSVNRAKALADLVKKQWPSAKIIGVEGRGVDYSIEQKQENWPLMRRADAYIWYHPVTQPRPKPVPQPELEPEPVVPEPEPVEEPQPHAVEYTYYEENPLFAVGTNAPYLLTLNPNLSVEIPLGRRWSIFGEHLFPWWIFNHNRTADQMVHSDLGVRYWFGDREKRDLLSGWHLGVLGEAGFGDLEPNGKGSQGEFFGGSLELGYSWKLSKWWRLDTGVSAGAIWSQRRDYVNKYNDEYLIWQESNDRFWFGPTRVRVGISYLFHTKKACTGVRYEY
ncbi:MAG: DUF3575 domain-containing protein [Bacteroidales bacterium]|nr:DUF3575 domain-containing protein [Bacteroidales bacterium]